MTIAERFTRIQDDFGNLKLLKNVRHAFIEELQYFKVQSELDKHAKNSVDVIHGRWKKFLISLRGVRLLEYFRADYLRRDVCSKRQPPQSPYRNWQILDLFFHLANEFEQKCDSKVADDLVLLFGLRVLLYESERPRWKRKHETIRYTWRFISPLLVQKGLLKRFETDSRICDQLNFFLTDSLSESEL